MKAVVTLVPVIERFCIPNFGIIFDCAFPKKARSEKRHFQCFAFRKSDSTSFPRVAMQNKMESVEGVEQDQGVVKYLVFYDSLSRIKSMCAGQTVFGCGSKMRTY